MARNSRHEHGSLSDQTVGEVPTATKGSAGRSTDQHLRTKLERSSDHTRYIAKNLLLLLFFPLPPSRLSFQRRRQPRGFSPTTGIPPSSTFFSECAMRTGQPEAAQIHSQSPPS